MKPTLQIIQILTALITLLLCSNVKGQRNLEGLKPGADPDKDDVLDFSYNRRNYKYVRYPFLNWFKAHVHCCSHFNGSLADMRSLEEVKRFTVFGYETINYFPGPTPKGNNMYWPPWLGGQAITQKSWTWANHANSTNLENGKLEFKPRSNVPQSCTQLYLGNIKGITTEYCYELHPFICHVP